MIDMFTIILVFLLKSYTTSAVNVSPQNGLRLPSSSAQTSPIEALKLSVSKEGIYVDEKLVVPLKSGVLEAKLTEKSDSRFIPKLFEALDAQAKRTQAIAKQNESVQFDGKVVFQADRELSYELLKKVMYTSALAGYADFKFAVVAQ